MQLLNQIQRRVNKVKTGGRIRENTSIILSGCKGMTPDARKWTIIGRRGHYVFIVIPNETTNGICGDMNTSYACKNCRQFYLEKNTEQRIKGLRVKRSVEINARGSSRITE